MFVVIKTFFFTSSFCKVINTLQTELGEKEMLVEELEALKKILLVKEQGKDNELRKSRKTLIINVTYYYNIT